MRGATKMRAAAPRGIRTTNRHCSTVATLRECALGLATIAVKDHGNGRVARAATTTASTLIVPSTTMTETSADGVAGATVASRAALVRRAATAIGIRAGIGIRIAPGPRVPRTVLARTVRVRTVRAHPGLVHPVLARTVLAHRGLARTVLARTV